MMKLKIILIKLLAISFLISCSPLNSPTKMTHPLPPPPHPPIEVAPPVIKDRDNDGIADSLDKCPDIPGPASNFGCPLTKENDNVGDGGNGGDGSNGGDGGGGGDGGTPKAGDFDTTKHSARQKPILKGNQITPQTDTSSPTPNKPPEITNDAQIKKASLGISYHHVMKQGETKDFSVHVDISHPEAALKTIIRNEETQENEWATESDTSIILTTQIEVYKKLSVTLEYDTADFIITPVDVKENQEIDYVNGNKWHWTIKAIAHKPLSSIRVIIDAETPDGAKEKISPKKIDIVIKIDARSAFRTAIDYLIDHPGYTIPTIIVPFVIFIFKRRKKETDSKPDKGNV